MTDDRPPQGSVPAARGLSPHLRAHAKALFAVGIASVLGILASFVFQLLSARSVTPSEFGLLSAFFVIVNVAAVGSASLQSTVTVKTAEALSAPVPVSRSSRRLPFEALVLGLAGGALVALASPWLADALDTNPPIILAAAVTIPLSFVFADAMGLLQGSGRISQAVWWSTFSQLGRVLFAIIVIIAGLGLGGMVGTVLAALLIAVVGGLWSARRIPRPAQGVFSLDGLTIVALTIAFAWLTTSDVIFLRAGAPSDLAGIYASATVLVKAGLLLPSTLSLYLLPRFVKHRDNPNLARVGVLVTLGVSLATSLIMIVGFAVLGDWLISLIYKEDYSSAAELLVPAAVAYLPWIAAQGMMIKMTSFASRGAALLLLVAVAAQAIGFSVTVPDVYAMLTVFASIGFVVLTTFLLIDARRAGALRSAVRARTEDPESDDIV